MSNPLPVEAIYSQLDTALDDTNRVILCAPPGAGKSTGVPLRLLDHRSLSQQKIILLEPRRLAARNVAERLASSLGESVGQTVGYRMRQDTKVGKATRLEVVTEGILTRMIQSDPELEGFGCIIFDEYHERSLQADLGLALCLDIQTSLRDDLKLLVMSATLDTDRLAGVLEYASVIHSEGRQYPVEVCYSKASSFPPRVPELVALVRKALAEHPGNILVFLPGVGEIKKAQELLQEHVPDDVLLTPLYGGLDFKQQRAAVQPVKSGYRKVVLSTNIAETSLTLEGISVVVDMGLERVSVFSPGKGMSSLITRAASKASAEQRAGRAGRLQAGVCYRLWSESDHLSRRAFSSPEIQEADLCSLVVELALWGITDPSDLPWIDVPPASLFSQAVELLQWLDVLDSAGRLTGHGKEVAALPVHPRLAHMMVLAKKNGAGEEAAKLAAILEERYPGKQSSSSDFRDRLNALKEPKSGAEKAWTSRVMRQVRSLSRLIKSQTSRDNNWTAAQLLTLAFPDRVGQRRSSSSRVYRLSGGGAAAFVDNDLMTAGEFIVVPEIDGRAKDSRIYSAIDITAQELEEVLGSHFEQREVVEWQESSGSVISEKQRCLGNLVMSREASEQFNPEAIAGLLIEQVRKRGLSLFDDYDSTASWRARVNLLRSVDGEGSEFPNVSDEALLDSLESWLSPWLDGISRLSQLKKVSLKSAFESMLDWPLQQRLTEEAPTHFKVPSGSRVALDYLNGDVPVLAARIQELFSATQTPSIANGRVKLMLHLLSPARRPIQITQDLVSFWDTGYTEVKKELKGRYPKHHWPDDPLNTAPHSTVRPKS